MVCHGKLLASRCGEKDGNCSTHVSAKQVCNSSRKRSSSGIFLLKALASEELNLKDVLHLKPVTEKGMELATYICNFSVI